MFFESHENLPHFRNAAVFETLKPSTPSPTTNGTYFCGECTGWWHRTNEEGADWMRRKISRLGTQAEWWKTICTACGGIFWSKGLEATFTGLGEGNNGNHGYLMENMMFGNLIFKMPLPSLNVPPFNPHLRTTYHWTCLWMVSMSKIFQSLKPGMRGGGCQGCSGNH